MATPEGWICNVDRPLEEVRVNDWVLVGGVPNRVTNKFVRRDNVILVFSQGSVSKNRYHPATICVTKGHRLLAELTL